jgi:hypothetical protein
MTNKKNKQKASIIVAMIMVLGLVIVGVGIPTLQDKAYAECHGFYGHTYAWPTDSDPEDCPPTSGN